MSAAVAVILINWKRPQNIGRLVRTVADALPAAAMLVIDHGKGADGLESRDDIARDRCWIGKQANAGAGARIKLAAAMPFDHYLCVDDDTFLSVEQIRALTAALAADPRRAHGLTGQLVSKSGNGPHTLQNCVTGSRDVSVVNQAFAFTRARAEATLRLAASIGFGDWSDVRRGDDILLSSAGPDPARIHDLGRFEQCPTSAADGIATCRSADFRAARGMLFEKLFRHGVLYVANDVPRSVQ